MKTHENAAEDWLFDGVETNEQGTGWPARVLDVGCGTGRFLETLHRRFPEAELHGLDPSAGMLAEARKRLSWEVVRWREGIATELPYGSDRFDLVVCSQVLHCVHIPDRAYAEMGRVLRPGGWLWVTDWDGGDWKTLALGQWLKLRGKAMPGLHRLGEAVAFAEAAGVEVRATGRKKADPRGSLYRLIGQKPEG